MSEELTRNRDSEEKQEESRSEERGPALPSGGLAGGAAIAGMWPIVFHLRMDFMLLAVDPIVSQAANWSYMFSGRVQEPVVVRATINRGGEQGAQHSQAVYAMFMHVPGLKVVMPSTASDAKGLQMAAVADGNPVMYIDDRWLYAEVRDRRIPSFSLGSAAKIGPAVKLRVSVIKTVAKRYFPTAGQWIIISQALERFLPQYCFQQHPKIG
jgi:hypothetical protein